MTKRICETCCWWNRLNSSSLGQCQLEPETTGKDAGERCRHHSFTTGWLDDDPQEDLAAKVKALSKRCKQARQLFYDTRGFFTDNDQDRLSHWLAGEDESPEYIDPKVKALSERCKQARVLITDNQLHMSKAPRQIECWLAGEDE